MDQERHSMVFEKTHPSGEDEWYCPTCGRRFLLQWPPNFKKTIIDPGDEQVGHSGGRGGLSMDSAQNISSEGVKEETENFLDDPRLAPWAAWLDEAGFEDLWSNDN